MKILTEAKENFSRLEDVLRGASFEVEVNGNMVVAYPGETVAAVLLACGQRVFNYASDGSPRGYSCGIGQCFCCLVTIDGVSNVRACQTLSRPGMKIQTGLNEATVE